METEKEKSRTARRKPPRPLELQPALLSLGLSAGFPLLRFTRPPRLRDAVVQGEDGTQGLWELERSEADTAAEYLAVWVNEDLLPHLDPRWRRILAVNQNLAIAAGVLASSYATRVKLEKQIDAQTRRHGGSSPAPAPASSNGHRREPAAAGASRGITPVAHPAPGSASGGIPANGSHEYIDTAGDQPGNPFEAEL